MKFKSNWIGFARLSLSNRTESSPLISQVAHSGRSLLLLGSCWCGCWLLGAVFEFVDQDERFAVLVVGDGAEELEELGEGEVRHDGPVVHGRADDFLLLLLHFDQAVVNRVFHDASGDVGFGRLADAVDAGEGFEIY